MFFSFTPYFGRLLSTTVHIYLRHLSIVCIVWNFIMLQKSMSISIRQYKIYVLLRWHNFFFSLHHTHLSFSVRHSKAFQHHEQFLSLDWIRALVRRAAILFYISFILVVHRLFCSCSCCVFYTTSRNASDHVGNFAIVTNIDWSTEKSSRTRYFITLGKYSIALQNIHKNIYSHRCKCVRRLFCLCCSCFSLSHEYIKCEYFEYFVTMHNSL